MTFLALLATVALAVVPAPGPAEPDQLAGPQRHYRTACGWFETADGKRAFLQLGREVRCTTGARLAGRIDPPFKSGPRFPRFGSFRCSWANPGGDRVYMYCRDTQVRRFRSAMTGGLGRVSLTIPTSGTWDWSERGS